MSVNDRFPVAGLTEHPVAWIHVSASRMVASKSLSERFMLNLHEDGERLDSTSLH